MPMIYRIFVGYALITAVVLISDRSRVMAGLLSTAPINIPIVLWILWGNNTGDFENMVLTSRSMLIGILSTASFIAACWFGFSRRWSFVMTMTVAYMVWAFVAFAPTLLRRLAEYMR